ncbi:MAG: hypothetical protein ACT4OF_11825 [Caulobacteraceae bacterium]
MPEGEESKSKRPNRPSKKSAARQHAAPDFSLTDALAEAAWSEADVALAQALADLDEAETAENETSRKDALTRLAQSLSRAGRKRGLTRVGVLGARVPFDSRNHELNAAVAKTPKTVLIQARGVARGDRVLERPRVAPAEQKKRS